MKNIQVSFDEKMLYEVDKAASLFKMSRSAIIRDAIKYWLNDKKIKEFEQNWIRSLKEHPDELDGIDEWTNIQIWSE